MVELTFRSRWPDPTKSRSFPEVVQGESGGTGARGNEDKEGKESEQE